MGPEARLADFRVIRPDGKVQLAVGIHVEATLRRRARILRIVDLSVRDQGLMDP